MRITKQEAAAEQIDQAIRSLFTNFIASAVTLAGAAEESLPPPDNSERVLFDVMKAHGSERAGLSPKEFVDQHANKARNWLKHHMADLIEVELQQEDGVIMILRAYTKFVAVFGENATTPKMRKFERWFRKKYEPWLSPHTDNTPT